MKLVGQGLKPFWIGVDSVDADREVLINPDNKKRYQDILQNSLRPHMAKAKNDPYKIPSHIHNNKAALALVNSGLVAGCRGYGVLLETAKEIGIIYKEEEVKESGGVRYIEFDLEKQSHRAAFADLELARDQDLRTLLVTCAEEFETLPEFQKANPEYVVISRDVKDDEVKNSKNGSSGGAETAAETWSGTNKM